MNATCDCRLQCDIKAVCSASQTPIDNANDCTHNPVTCTHNPVTCTHIPVTCTHIPATCSDIPAVTCDCTVPKTTNEVCGERQSGRNPLCDERDGHCLSRCETNNDDNESIYEDIGPETLKQMV
mgnify:CR=1 FL=1